MNCNMLELVEGNKLTKNVVGELDFINELTKIIEGNVHSEQIN